MKSQTISSGRNDKIHWECVETEKVRIKRALLDLPAICGNFTYSCTHSQNRQIFPNSQAFKKTKYETSNVSRRQAM
jgi:hypothetical protein